MFQRLRVLLVALPVWLVASTAAADISLRLNNEQLTAEAEAIVIGRVVASESRWIDRTLVTAVTVQIAETIKGTVSGQIEVLLPGGVDANRRVKVAMTYPGAPQMRDGEDVFLFLTQDSDVGGLIVAGFAQGKFSILTQQGGTRVVSRDLRGSQLVEGTGLSRGTVDAHAARRFPERNRRLSRPLSRGAHNHEKNSHCRAGRRTHGGQRSETLRAGGVLETVDITGNCDRRRFPVTCSPR